MPEERVVWQSDFRRDCGDALGRLDDWERPPHSPGVLCPPGHGRGVDSVAGIAPDGSQRPLRGPDECAQDFGLQCVARGCQAFALELPGFALRRDAAARAQGPDASSCGSGAVTLP